MSPEKPSAKAREAFATSFASRRLTAYLDMPQMWGVRKSMLAALDRILEEKP